MHDLVKSSALLPGAACTTRPPGADKSRGGSARPRASGGRQMTPKPRRRGSEACGRAALGGRTEHVSHHLETISSRCILSPLRLQPANLRQVHSRLHAELPLLETLAQGHEFPVRHDMLKKVRHQCPPGALVDFWWAGVEQDWSRRPSPRPGGMGAGVPATMGLLEHQSPTRAARGGKPRCRGPGRRCAAR